MLSLKKFSFFLLLTSVSLLLCTFSMGLAEEYVVRDGDTLSEIAAVYDMSSKELCEINGLPTDYVILPGDVLYVPGSASSAGSSSYWITISASDVNLRQSPSLDSEIICALKKGESAEILEDRGQWCYIVLADGYEGWISADYIGSGPVASSSSYTYTPGSYIAKSYICSTNTNVRNNPGKNEQVLFCANKDETVYVLDYTGDWIYVAFTDGAEGWVYYDYIDIYHGQPSVEEQKNTPQTLQVAQVEEEELQPAPVQEKPKSIAPPTTQVTNPQNTELSSRGSALGASIVQLAYSYMGIPYVWGGTSPSGFDCSGFVQTVYALNGINISRTADTQFMEGSAVNKGDLRLGDLVFFTTYTYGASHVGIYIGNSQFVHASSSGGCVTISSLEDDYYKSRYLGAKRFF